MQNYKNSKKQSFFTGTQEGTPIIVRNTRRAKTNTVLIIIAIILAVVAIVVSTAALVLLANRNSQKNTNNSTVDDNIQTLEGESYKNKEQAEMKNPPINTPLKKMYVDCNTTLFLRKGPGKDYPAILEMPVGSEVDYMSTAENGFARVRYDGMDGYASIDYLSDSQPFVWNYNENEVKAFVEKVLYAYVDSINYDNLDILTPYLAGPAISDARKTHNAVISVVDSEQVLSVNCNNVKRVAKDRVTVERTSTIRIFRKNGNIDDKTEKYLTTVEYTSNGMRVMKFQAM